MANRYFISGQVYVANGTGVITEAGRQTATITLHVTTEGSFVFSRTEFVTASVASGTATVADSPKTITLSPTTVNVTGTGTIVLTITVPASINNSWTVSANWSASSGGAGGASVPTSADSVYFDANSFTAASQVLTVDATANCKDMDWTGATNTPALTHTNQINLYGALTFIAGMTHTGTTRILYQGAGNVNHTFGGTLSCAVTYYGAGGTVTFQDALNVGTQTVAFDRSAVDTNGQTITCGACNTTSTGEGCTLTLGATTINCTAFTKGAGALTLTANTSTINVTGTGACALGNANYNGASFNLNGTAHTVSGSPTGIATFTRNGTATKTNTITMTSGATLTCTTFAMKGNSATNRLLVQSSTLGTAATITATNWTGSQHVDIMDITATNAVDLSAITGNSGDCGGNTNITFTPAAAQTSSKASTWSDATMWTSRVPLPQDDVTCSHNVTVDMPRIGKSITFTGTPTVSLSLSVYYYGSAVYASGMTFTHNNNEVSSMGRGSYSITSNGVTLRNLIVSCPGGTVLMSDAYVFSDSISIRAGTWDCGTANGTSPSLSQITTGIYTSATRAINLGTGTLTLNGTGASAKWTFTGTLTAGTSTIVLTNSTANAQTFAGGGLTYNNVTVQGAGAYSLTITGENTFNAFTIDRSQAAKTIVATGTTQALKWFICTPAGRTLCTITGGTWVKVGGGQVNLKSISVSGMTVLPSNAWYMGLNSTNGGSNSNVIFRRPLCCSGANVAPARQLVTPAAYQNRGR